MKAVAQYGKHLGWDALALSDGDVRIVILPERGAEIYAIIDLASGIDVLFKLPAGLRPPGAEINEGAGGIPFLERYAGGWQELFPSVGASGSVAGEEVAFHGEVATTAWDCSLVDGGTAVRCSVRSRSGLELSRVMRLEPGHRTLLLDEQVTNHARSERPFVWGHHCVLGAPLLASGAGLQIDCGTLRTPSEAWDSRARLAPGQISVWPFARLSDEGIVDLRQISGPSLRSHDDVYLSELRAGRARVENAMLDLGVELTFDETLFRHVVLWQIFGGGSSDPFIGSYGLGIEPWVSAHGLSRAIEEDEALLLQPGERLRTQVRFALTSTSAPTSA